MRLTIKSITGITMNVEVDHTANIGDVKQQIFQKYGVDSFLQVIYNRTKQYHDWWLLSDMSIDDLSTLTMYGYTCLTRTILVEFENKSNLRKLRIYSDYYDFVSK